MPGRKWRLGVGTTTSYDLIARSGTNLRYRSSIGHRHAAHGDRFTPWKRPAGRSSIGGRLKTKPGLTYDRRENGEHVKGWSPPAACAGHHRDSNKPPSG